MIPADLIAMLVFGLQLVQVHATGDVHANVITGRAWKAHDG